MRFNGWQRIGIVASIVWALGAAVWTVHSDDQAYEQYRSNYQEKCRDVVSWQAPPAR
jgi:hypothetical protein